MFLTDIYIYIYEEQANRLLCNLTENEDIHTLQYKELGDEQKFECLCVVNRL